MAEYNENSNSYPVYLSKPWFDHSKDAFSAWTITLTADHGVYVIAVLVLLVRVAGEALWTITACALHQIRAKNKPENTLFKQLQVILRNSGTSLASALEIVGTGWASRATTRNAFWRAVKIAFWPLIIFISFTVAEILVSRVAVPTYDVDRVLLKPTTCGLTSWTGLQGFDANGARLRGKMSDDIRQSRAYANQCFGKENKTLGCTFLPTQQLPYAADMDADCPMSGRCWLGEKKAMRLDTGLLDSHDHLGVNAKQDDRVQFQIASTCSVVRITDLLELVQNPFPDLPNIESVIRANLGSLGSQNFTWEYNTVQSTQSVAYTIHPFTHTVGDNATTTSYSISAWTPIPELRFDDADTTIAFLAFNKVLYLETNFDPLFSANGTYPLVGEQDGITYYEPDLYFGTVVCKDQLKICNVRTNTCSPFSGMKSIDLSSLDLNDKQYATAQRIQFARWSSNIYSVIAGQGPVEAIDAYRFLVDRFSYNVPDDQWITEITKWYKASLANIQYRMVEFPNNAISQYSSSENMSLNYTAAEAMSALCHNQLVRSTAQCQSFSLAGLLIVVIFSCSIIFTSWGIDSCVAKRKDRRDGGVKRYKRLAWIADGKLQLLRMALQGAGYDGWEDELEKTPTRKEREGQDIEAVVEEVEAGGKIRVRYRDVRARQAMVEDIEFQTLKKDHEQEAQIPSVTVSLEEDETRRRTSSEGRYYSIPLQSQQSGADDPLLPHRNIVYGRGRTGQEPYGPDSY
ncbi:hypothetical protein HII31_08423 [Pseudocercospora fuligena]|uniref:Uncharacterized protein n=1 Tax=Pseudocercospora fuligena TaxID=685502 RepID=A0A8H6VGX0_9PEZI|nr:hypothetical protein HII31_08423 [Pseudocercospora fuligena]